MTLRSDAKFEEKLTCGLKNDMRNLANFHQSTWKCQNWDFDRILLSKVEKYMSLKCIEELCVKTMKNDTKTEEELTSYFKIDMRNWQILTWTIKNLKKLLFNWLLWPKYIMFELKKVQRSYLWWHWRLMQNLKENWLLLWKMTWRIWQICIGWNKWIPHLIKLLQIFNRIIVLKGYLLYKTTFCHKVTIDV